MRKDSAEISARWRPLIHGAELSESPKARSASSRVATKTSAPAASAEAGANSSTPPTFIASQVTAPFGAFHAEVREITRARRFSTGILHGDAVRGASALLPCRRWRSAQCFGDAMALE